MFTIKQAARTVGVAEATLRTWERRYGVVTPERTEGGYRLYDEAALTTLTEMRRLVDAGWSPATAARAVLERDLLATVPPRSDGAAGTPAGILQAFLDGAARMDPHATRTALDHGMSLGSFEHAVDTWLFPALIALGEGWARGEIDVAGEHMASHLVLRRLSAAFEAAGTRTRWPKVVVGLPPGSTHELGALAFATACRRIGLDVLYLGADVPEESWLAAVEGHGADAAVLTVVSAADRPAARAVAQRLQQRRPGMIVAAGGGSSDSLEPVVRSLAHSVGAAAQELDALLHPSPSAPPDQR